MMHVRPYLYHTESMTVITVQIKAWMDSVSPELELEPNPNPNLNPIPQP